jgi:4-hydroxy-tetrahydrodipicolinate synthase
MPSSGTAAPGQLGRGTWYLLPTPFTAEGELDLASLRVLCDAAVSWGVTGLTVMGVMSEPGSLAASERTDALKTIFEVVAGRVPVVVGCSATTPLATLRLVRQARELGAAAAMVAAPTLLRNIDLLPGYYGALHRDSGLPILLQDEPAASGVLIPASVLVQCAEAAGSNAIKVEDPPTPPKIARLKAVRDDFLLFGGLGGMAALGELKSGAAGTMTGFAYPEVMKAVRLAGEAGDWPTASAIFDHFLPLIVFEAQPVIGLGIRKEVLRRRGVLATNRTRGLIPHLDAAASAELDDIFGRVGLVPATDPYVVPATLGAAR